MVRDRPRFRGEAPDRDLHAWRDEAVRAVMRAMLLPGAIWGGIAVYRIYALGRMWQVVFPLIGYVLLAFTVLWQRVPLKIRTHVLLFLLCGVSAGALALPGQAVIALAVLATVPFLAWLFVGRRGAMFWWGTGMAELVGWEILALAGHQAGLLGQWIAVGAGYALCSLLLILPADHVFRRMEAALRGRRELADQLRSERDRLRLQVAERTMDLELRAQYLEAITEVTHSASAITDDTQGLLSQVVDLVSERFAFYHTGVFLLDEDRAWLELQSASSEEGQRLLRQRYRLSVGGEAMVAQVAASGLPRIGSDAASCGASYLPETQSEIALPLRVRGETIGVLDVQSAEVAAFSDDDVTVLQILADQVAIALSNTRLFAQLQASIEAMRKAYGEMGLEAWQTLLRSQGGAVARYDPNGAFAQGDASVLAQKARHEGEAVVRNEGNGAAALPIKVRGGHVIGTVEALKAEGQGAWTPEELQVLGSLVDQLGIALDGAQLYQESQRRAERERIAAGISARMRETLSVDAVLQTAIREIGDALGLAEVEIRMVGEAEVER